MYGISSTIVLVIQTILESIQGTELQKRKNATIVMFDVLLKNVYRTEDRSLKKLLQTMHEKAVQGSETDPRFEEYIDKFGNMLKEYPEDDGNANDGNAKRSANDGNANDGNANDGSANDSANDSAKSKDKPSDEDDDHQAQINNSIREILEKVAGSSMLHGNFANGGFQELDPDKAMRLKRELSRLV